MAVHAADGRRCLRVLVAAAVTALLVATWPPPSSAASSEQVRILEPAAGQRQSGLIDLAVAAPAGTTAVRFFVDDVQLSEITDQYARATGGSPQWRTVTDAQWFRPGTHVLRVEADTPSGTVTTQQQLITYRPPAPQGITSLSGGWLYASAQELPPGALEGAVPAATQPDFDDGAFARVMVPNSIGAVDDRYNTWDGLVGVYRTTVPLEEPEDGERTALVLESCYFECTVYVNGTRVDAARGGYLTERFDVTDVVRPGDNAVAVVVDSRQSTMGVLDRIQAFYWNWGGLLQEVRVERTPAVALTALRAEGSAAGALTLRPVAVNGNPTERLVEVQVEVLDPGGRRVLGPQRHWTTVPPGGGQTTPITVMLANPALWGPEAPHLYTVEVRGLGEAQWRLLSERTGFRDVGVDGSDVILNGRVLSNLQGFNRHLDAPGLGRTQPDGLARRELTELHDKGFRIYRPAHYPTTPGELEVADELGLLVIEEINVTGLSGSALSTPQVRQFAEDRLTKMIHRDRSHPSIIAWSVGNENLTEDAGAGEYVRDTIALGRSLDSSRLYTQVTHRGTRDRTFAYQDLVAHNYYAGWYTNRAATAFGSDPVDPVTRLLDRVQSYAGDKPILLSEYGAEAVAGRPGTSKGTEFYQGYVVDEHNRLLDRRPHTLGKMYWTATEFWCRPDWSGGNPEPIPPFHAKALRSLTRQDKLAWRVVFSPIRIADDGAVLQAPPETDVVLRHRVVIRDVRDQATTGSVVVQAPEGFTAEPVEQPFSVEAGGQTTVEVMLRGRLPDAADSTQGIVRAVVDDDTEAQPSLLTVRRADDVVHPASDAFEADTLGGDWRIVRDDASGWSLTDPRGALRLTTLDGDLSGAANDGRNVFVRENTPDFGHTAVAQVDGELTDDGQELSLLAYSTDDDYTRVGLSRANGAPAIVFEHERAGRTVQRSVVPFDGDAAWLRLVVRDGSVNAEYSGDDEFWYTAGQAPAAAQAKIALQATGGGQAVSHVRDLTVRVSGRVTIDGLQAEQPLLGGRSNTAAVSVTNARDEAVEVTADVVVPAGWSTVSTRARLDPFTSKNLAVAVTPPLAPTITTISAAAHAEGLSVYGSAALPVITTPPGDAVPMALDAGRTGSPVFGGYGRLSPADAWDPGLGFGWVGDPPADRDRGLVDDLRRDFVLSREPATLRLAVPPGRHDAYLLAGDAAFSSGDTVVSENGEVLAQIGQTLARGEFRYLTFELDGGADGRTADLVVSGRSNNYWRVVSFVLVPER